MDFKGDFNPWKTIWTKPKNTIREALETDSKWPWILAMLFGLTMFLDHASNKNLGDKFPVNQIILLSLIIGPILGLVGWMITSGIVHWSARIFKGTGTWKDTRNAVAWSSIPFVAKLLLWIPQLLLFGSEMFKSETPVMDNNFFLLLFFLLFMLIEIVLVVWFFVTISHGIGVAHDFSAWKGFSSLFMIPVTFIVLLIILAELR